MALKKKLRREIDELSFGDAKEAFHELQNRLGVVSQTDFIDMVKYPKTRQMLHVDMKLGRVSSVKVANIYFPCIGE